MGSGKLERPVLNDSGIRSIDIQIGVSAFLLYKRGRRSSTTETILAIVECNNPLRILVRGVSAIGPSPSASSIEILSRIEVLQCRTTLIIGCHIDGQSPVVDNGMCTPVVAST